MVQAYRSEKVDFPELGPVNVLEYKFAVGLLPQ